MAGDGLTGHRVEPWQSLRSCPNRDKITAVLHKIFGTEVALAVVWEAAAGQLSSGAELPGSLFPGVFGQCGGDDRP